MRELTEAVSILMEQLRHIFHEYLDVNQLSGFKGVFGEI